MIIDTKLLIQHIQKEIQEVKTIIENRAKERELSDEQRELMDCNLDYNPFDDAEDRENYEFDNGKMYGLKIVMSYLAKLQSEEYKRNGIKP